DEPDGCEVLFNRIAKVGAQAWTNTMAVYVRHQQRGAVILLLGGMAGGNDACGAGLVFHDHRHAPHVIELLAQQAGQDVGATSRTETHDQAHRAGWRGRWLRLERRRKQCGGQGAARNNEVAAIHDLSLFFNVDSKWDVNGKRNYGVASSCFSRLLRNCCACSSVSSTKGGLTVRHSGVSVCQAMAAFMAGIMGKAWNTARVWLMRACCAWASGSCHERYSRMISVGLTLAV